VDTIGFVSSIQFEIWNSIGFGSSIEAKRIGSLIFTLFSRLLWLKVIKIVWNLMVKNPIALMNYKALRFSQWKSITLFGVNTSKVYSQEFSSRPKSFHLMRYWNFSWCQQLSRIFSTSYSSCLSMRIESKRGLRHLLDIGSIGVVINLITLNTKFSLLSNGECFSW